MKKYKVTWVDPTAHVQTLEIGESNNLKNVCFNWACKMIATSPSIFKCDKDRVIDNIKQGRLRTGREHWMAFLGEEVIDVMEVRY